VPARAATTSCENFSLLVSRLRCGRSPEQFREVVYYRDAEGLRHREIAALMNIPCGTVISRLHRGRRRLRGLPGNANDSPPRTSA
jgi:DNA-directed RNA polymerase specialized sigma24 family protein